MLRRALVGLLVGLLGACHSGFTVDLPAPPDGTRATLLVLEDAGSADHVWAFDGGPERIPVFTAPLQGPVLLLYYAHDLEELGLAEGEAPLASPGAPGRPLASPQLGLRAERSKDGLSPWQPIEADDPQFARIRLEDRPIEACLDAGGCYARAEDISARVCSFGCESRRSPQAPAPVQPPSVVDFEPCPPGWSASTSAGVVTCTPASAAPPVCGADEAAWPSSSQCVRLGPPCPGPLGFAEDLPTDRPIVYLRRGALGGDGSRAAPFGIYLDAVAATPPGGILAMSEGDYEPLGVPSGVTLWGACVAGTRVLGDTDGYALEMFGAQTGLHNLTIIGPDGGLYVRDAESTLQAVAVEGHRSRSAVIIERSTITARRLRIRGTREHRMPGLRVLRGASVSLTQAMLDDNGSDSVRVEDEGSRLVLEDAEVFVDARRNFSDSALYAVRGSTIVARGVRVRGFRRRGARTVGPGAHLELQQVILQDFTDVDDLAAAVFVDEGSSADLSRVLVQRVDGSALVVQGGTVIADRLVAVDGLGEREGHVRVSGGRLQLARTDLREAVGYGIQAHDATVVLRDVRIRDVTRRAWDMEEDPDVGVGIALAAGTQVDGARVAMERLDSHGLLLGYRPSEVPVGGRIEDLSILDVDARSAPSGVGIYVRDAAEFELARVRVDGVVDSALLTAETGSVEVEDLHLARARFGLRATDGSSVDIARAEVEATRGAAICIRKASVVRMSDLAVDNVTGLRDDESNAVCEGGMMAAGDGVIVNEFSRASLERYRVRGCVGSGVRALSTDALVAQDGMISTCAETGMELAPGAELQVHLLRTQFEGNETNLSAP